MKRTPIVAERRRKDAIVKFKNKLELLEKLLESNNTDQCPTRASLSSFMQWEEPQLGVYSLSRSLLYDRNNEVYVELRTRVERLLGILAKKRTKSAKNADVLGDLQEQLASMKERANSYVNQYSSVSAELEIAKAEIAKLKDKLRRISDKPSLSLVSVIDKNPKFPSIKKD